MELCKLLTLSHPSHVDNLICTQFEAFPHTKSTTLHFYLMQKNVKKKTQNQARGKKDVRHAQCHYIGGNTFEPDAECRATSAHRTHGSASFKTSRKREVQRKANRNIWEIYLWFVFLSQWNKGSMAPTKGKCPGQTSTSSLAPLFIVLTAHTFQITCMSPI